MLPYNPKPTTNILLFTINLKVHHIKRYEKNTRGATSDDFSGQFFCIFEIINFCCVVAICDLVQDVENIFHLSYVLRASENLF